MNYLKTKFFSVAGIRAIGGALGVSIIIPKLAFAYTCTYAAGTLGAIMCTVVNLLNIAIPLLITLGVAWFIWGVVSYITAKDEEKKGAARSTMIHGIIGLFVMVCVWGLVNILATTFDVQSGGSSQALPIL